MSVSVNDLARELIERLGLDPATAAGSDKLHKLLYYVQGHHAAVLDRAVFAEPIEAAESGPVVLGFLGVDLDASRGKLDDDALNAVGYVARRYGQLSVLDLQHLTRAEPPWQTARRAPDRQVQLDDMVAYFRGGGAPFGAFEGAPIDRAVEGGRLLRAAPGPTPAQPARKRRRWPWAVGVVLAMVLGYSALFAVIGFGRQNAVDSTDDKGAVAGRMGAPVRDGTFEFTVSGVACGESTTDDGFSPRAARGMFCMVTVSVRNVGTQAQPFDESNQKAYDEKGARYSHDAPAEYDANAGAHTWFLQIEPGSQVTGKLVFDVPVSIRLTSVELHDSPSSVGVIVPLA